MQLAKGQGWMRQVEAAKIDSTAQYLKRALAETAGLQPIREEALTSAEVEVWRTILLTVERQIEYARRLAASLRLP